MQRFSLNVSAYLITNFYSLKGIITREIEAICTNQYIYIYTSWFCWKRTKRWEAMLFWSCALEYLCQHRNGEIFFNRFWCSNDTLCWTDDYNDDINENCTPKFLQCQLLSVEIRVDHEHLWNTKKVYCKSSWKYQFSNLKAETIVPIVVITKYIIKSESPWWIFFLGKRRCVQ